MDVLFATNNPGKMREFRALLAPLEARVLFPPDLGLDLQVVEDGATYAENASIKARAFSRTGQAVAGPLLTLADDSGLEVDALDGAPGLHSARYTPGSDTDRVANLLAHLEGVAWEQRTARFRCVIAIAPPEGEVQVVEGVCEGMIALEPAGGGGFGYDPVFHISAFGCTMAELPAEIKNRISHRGRAAAAALPILRRLCGLT
jgi:XTP/dITP diphosphohydrolase